MSERLQKVLAGAGIASRRQCEELIAAGQVEVNGEIVTDMGVKVDPGTDKIKVEGVSIGRVQPVYLVLNKPPGMITTMNDPEGRPTVADLLPKDMPRAFPVGRLDWDTQGVLLFTNDGELAHRLLHPRHGVTKVYRAKVEGHPDPATLERLGRGVDIGEGERSAAADLELIDSNPTNAWIKVILAEGRHHEVKRMFAAVNHPVIKLRRDVFAGLTAKGLKVGEFRTLSRGEANELRASVELPGLPPRGIRSQPWEAADPEREKRRATELVGGKAAHGVPRNAPRAEDEPFGPWHPKRRTRPQERPEQGGAPREAGDWRPAQDGQPGRGDRPAPRRDDRPAPRRDDDRSHDDRGGRSDRGPARPFGHGPRREEGFRPAPRRDDDRNRDDRSRDDRGGRSDRGPAQPFGRGPRRDDGFRPAPRRDDDRNRGDQTRGPRPAPRRDDDRNRDDRGQRGGDRRDQPSRGQFPDRGGQQSGERPRRKGVRRIIRAGGNKEGGEK